ncbi:CD9 antigen-like [Ruditapes philippinarum]|uniref:CD9 antigen-like n=1 Tax=Ruditapes philippinarum TaxID=129788 RepID=UPI00295B7FE5|nr:CD9 antigen-like [Ruditapes philippinarum]
MALGSCYTCIRYLMFAFNFLFWLLGCAILGIGIWVRVDENFGKYVNNSNHFDLLYTGAYIFIVVGILIMVVGFLGCCGAIRENQCMLGLFFALLFIIFVILLGAGIWAVVARDEVEGIVNKSLNDGVKGYFNEKSPEREFMDIVQNDFKCCGATKGGDDYGADKVGMVEACQKYTEPCNKQLFEFVKENLVIIAGVSIGIAVILILGMIFSMILCCALRDAQID